MCGRGRFAILAACLLNQYAQPCSRRRKGKTAAPNTEPSSSAATTTVVQDTSVKEEPTDTEVDFPTTENLSPGMECPVLYKAEDELGSRLVAENMIWGIIPTYLTAPTANDHYRMFNKRIESLERTEVAPYFKTVLQTKRCVVFLDGFYEWKMVAGKKHPYYVSLGPSEPMKMAGIYEESTVFDPKIYGMRQAKTFSIITSDSCGKFSSVHTRQPVLLTGEQVTRWLDCPAEEVFTVLEELKRNHTQDLPMNRSIHFHPVNPKVTNPRYQEPDCRTHKAVGTQLTSFFKAASPVSSSSSSSSSHRKDEDAEVELARSASQRTDTTEMLPTQMLPDFLDEHSGTEAKEGRTDEEVRVGVRRPDVSSAGSAVLDGKVKPETDAFDGDDAHDSAHSKRAKHQHESADAQAQSPVKSANNNNAATGGGAAVTPTKTTLSSGAKPSPSPSKATGKKAGAATGKAESSKAKTAGAGVGAGKGSPAGTLKLRPITSFFAPSPKK